MYLRPDPSTSKMLESQSSSSSGKLSKLFVKALCKNDSRLQKSNSTLLTIQCCTLLENILLLKLWTAVCLPHLCYDVFSN